MCNKQLLKALVIDWHQCMSYPVEVAFGLAIFETITMCFCVARCYMYVCVCVCVCVRACVCAYMLPYMCIHLKWVHSYVYSNLVCQIMYYEVHI